MSADPRRVVGIVRAPGDSGKAEPRDPRWRLHVGDRDDIRTLAQFVVTLLLVIVAFAAVGFAIRLFLWAAGFRGELL
jgi:hypothetical protein